MRSKKSEAKEAITRSDALGNLAENDEPSGIWARGHGAWGMGGLLKSGSGKMLQQTSHANCEVLI